MFILVYDTVQKALLQNDRNERQCWGYFIHSQEVEEGWKQVPKVRAAHLYGFNGPLLLC